MIWFFFLTYTEVLQMWITGLHEAIQHASIVSSGDTRQPVRPYINHWSFWKFSSKKKGKISQRNYTQVLTRCWWELTSNPITPSRCLSTSFTLKLNHCSVLPVSFWFNIRTEHLAGWCKASWTGSCPCWGSSCWETTIRGFSFSSSSLKFPH